MWKRCQCRRVGLKVLTRIKGQPCAGMLVVLALPKGEVLLLPPLSRQFLIEPKECTVLTVATSVTHHDFPQ